MKGLIRPYKFEGAIKFWSSCTCAISTNKE